MSYFYLIILLRELILSSNSRSLSIDCMNTPQMKITLKTVKEEN